MKYIPFGEQNNHHKAYIITDDNDIEIGQVEGNLNDYGEFITVVKLYSSQNQRKGLGFNAFNKVYNELNETLPVEIIKGSWHSGEEFESYEEGMSTNLKKFFEEKENGKNDQEAAFQTPTGKWAKKLGYEECNVISVSRESTQVDFIKKQ